MPENDHSDEARLAPRYFLGNPLGPPSLRLGIDNGDGMASIASIASDQTAPEGRLNSGELVTQFLVDLPSTTGVDEEEIKVGIRH